MCRVYVSVCVLVCVCVGFGCVYLHVCVQYWSRVIAHFTRAYDIASASKSLASKSPMIYARSV